jgi:uncharacterized membrane protein YeaQ/YmgE (transglycosylase-associated protein family)
VNPLTIIGTIILGAIAGYLASIVVGTNEQQGCLADIVVGVIGSFIGSFVKEIFFGAGLLGPFLDTILFAVIGAIIFLVALQMLIPKRRRRRRRRKR